jgi:hypothetical protein
MKPDTERLRELLDKATLGPWDADRAVVYVGRQGDLEVDGHPAWGGFDLRYVPRGEANAALIAELRNQAPALLDALTAAEARADKAEAERDELTERKTLILRDMSQMFSAAEDEKHEALNQLDSERHSVAVLEKRVAELRAALAAAAAQVAELRAENARLVEALGKIEAGLPAGSSLVSGDNPLWRDAYRDLQRIARAALEAKP